MNWVTKALTSSIGGKLIVAVTGIMAVGFVCGHLVGNMTIYAGPDAINAYAAGLHKIPALLWGARIGVIVAFGLHILLTLKLNLENKVARPVGYAKNTTIQATFASRTMVYTGIFLGLFLLFHLAHLTWRITHPEYQTFLTPEGGMDVYKMMITTFSVPWISGLYVVCMVLLGFHLSHAVTSFFQTLGLSHPKYDGLIHLIGPALGVFVAGGNITIPLAILFKCVV